jgi:hypothetical protein
MIEPYKIDRDFGERVEAELGRNQISLELASDWAGDTETGFGNSVVQHLTFTEAAALRDWLTEALHIWEDA